MSRPPVPLHLVLLVAFAAVTWGGLTVSETLASQFNLLIFVFANFVASADLFDFGVRVAMRQPVRGSGAHGWQSPTSVPLDVSAYPPFQKRVHLKPYAFVMSVYNAETEIDDFLTAMAPYRDRFWIIDDGSTDRTCQRLQQAGWRCIEGGKNRKKPAALQVLLRSLPPAIETVIVVDPDFEIRDSRIDDLSTLETVLFDFQQSDMAALCPYITVRRDGLLARLQAFEYCTAFSLGRRSLGRHSITSGASIYRRTALGQLLKHHSLSVYGEDLENSVIMLAEGEQVYYDSRLVLVTDAKRTWQGWFSQRVGWAYGLMAVYMRHAARIWRTARSSPGSAYHFLFYCGCLVLLLHPVRVFSMTLLLLGYFGSIDRVLGTQWLTGSAIADPAYFFAAYTSYAVLGATALWVAVPREDRAYLAPVVPLYIFYALVQVIPVTVGFANWFSLRLLGHRLWGDHYQDEASLRNEVQRWDPTKIRGTLGFEREF